MESHQNSSTLKRLLRVQAACNAPDRLTVLLIVKWLVVMNSSSERLSCFVVLLLLFSCGGALLAQDQVDVGQNLGLPTEPLRVATKHIPPFAIKNTDGSWSGISIELWKELTDVLNLEYEFQELTLEETFEGLESGDLDAAVAAISVTSQRHEQVDFCHPHFSTGLGIAVSARNRTSPWSILQRVASGRLVFFALLAVGVVVCCGILFWYFERNRNDAIFGGKKRKGIGMGVWWATIVLFGHKGVMPASLMGRMLAVLAMVLSVLLLSIFTGVITSVLTIQQLDVGITHATDLHRLRVATVAASTSADYLRQRRIAFQVFDTAADAMKAVDDNAADAMVYDEALLQYMAKQDFPNRIDMLPISFNIQDYAIALRPKSSLRRPLNEELLRYRESDAWDDLVYRYLGTSAK